MVHVDEGVFRCLRIIVLEKIGTNVNADTNECSTLGFIGIL
jgi:hypothetical protein